ncbi:putative pentatricopeptide repeat-containing protein At5g52630 [Malus domestica]|uniref:putative pentatricopeptide repeat-containing protein At5g52630 n=1 Tax=Malus domestica TaxID=3750 RepID=UPI00397533F5
MESLHPPTLPMTSMSCTHPKPEHIGLYPQKTVVTINCMLSGFVKNSLFGVALDLFNRVLSCDFCLGLKPNYVTLVVLISSLCMEYHAGRMFYEMPERYLVLWNTMIAGYAGVGDCRRAFSLFREMKAGDFGFDKVSLIGLILAACNSRDLGMGKMIHGYDSSAQMGRLGFSFAQMCSYIYRNPN